jgi:hypothetical protein
MARIGTDFDRRLEESMKQNALNWTTVTWLLGGLALEGEFGPRHNVKRWIQTPSGRRQGTTLSGAGRDWHFPDHATFRHVHWKPEGEMRVTLASGDVLTFDHVVSASVESWTRSWDKERYFSLHILGDCTFRASVKGGDSGSGGASWLP